MNKKMVDLDWVREVYGSIALNDTHDNYGWILAHGKEEERKALEYLEGIGAFGVIVGWDTEIVSELYDIFEGDKEMINYELEFINTDIDTDYGKRLSRKGISLYDYLINNTPSNLDYIYDFPVPEEVVETIDELRRKGYILTDTQNDKHIAFYGRGFRCEECE